MSFKNEQTLSSLRQKLEGVQDFILAMQFDQHFLDEASIQEFNSVELSKEEKQQIRELLAKARELTETANFLSDNHKRRILLRISEVENELFKEIAGFKAFIVAAAEVSGLVKKVGEDAAPLANAIQEARTITERKVEGYRRIEEAEKPKQLEGPKDSDGSKKDEE